MIFVECHCHENWRELLEAAGARSTKAWQQLQLRQPLRAHIVERSGNDRNVSIVAIEGYRQWLRFCREHVHITLVLQLDSSRRRLHADDLHELVLL